MRHFTPAHGLLCLVVLSLSPLAVHAAPEADAERCALLPENGECKAMIERAYFEPEDQRCITYYYDGCGPVVPFDSLEACRAACEAPGDGTSR